MAWRKGWPSVADVQAHAAAHGRDGAGLWLIRDDRDHVYVVRLAADSGEVEYTFDQSDGAEWFSVANYGRDVVGTRTCCAGLDPE